LVECTLETKPLERNADYAVSLKVEPVEVIYDSVRSSVSAIFCSFTSAFCGFASCMKYETRCNTEFNHLDHFCILGFELDLTFNRGFCLGNIIEKRLTSFKRLPTLASASN